LCCFLLGAELLRLHHPPFRDTRLTFRTPRKSFIEDFRVALVICVSRYGAVTAPSLHREMASKNSEQPCEHGVSPSVVSGALAFRMSATNGWPRPSQLRCIPPSVAPGWLTTSDILSSISCLLCSPSFFILVRGRIY